MSYKDRARANGDGATAAGGEYRCAFCGDTAAFATLATFGARCGRCYAAYCRTLPALPAPVPADAVPPGAPAGLRWAWVLRARHERGDSLTQAQVDSYTAALRHRGGELSGPFASIGVGDALGRLAAAAGGGR